jgi:hypothetical protein
MEAVFLPDGKANYCPHCGAGLAAMVMVADGDGIADEDWDGTPLRHEDAELHAEWTSRRITAGDRAAVKPLRVEVYVHAETPEAVVDSIEGWADGFEDIGRPA